MALRVLMISGDASGDDHGARVATALKAKHPDVILEGVGGAAMAKAGVNLLSDQSNMGKVGLETFFSAFSHWRLGQKIMAHAKQYPPDMIVHIDYGVFNLWMAKQFKQAKHRPPHQKNIYYIPPQVWGSRPGRIQKIKASIDHVCCIFPFEQDLYEKHDIPVTYVGHPLASQLPPVADKAAFCAQHNLDPEAPIVAVFPGSRKLEINYLLAPMIQGIQQLQAQRQGLALPSVQPVLVQAGNLDKAWFAKQLAIAMAGQPPSLVTVVSSDERHVVQSVAAIGLVKSGTTTLEMALYGTPMVITYKAHPFAAWLARKLTLVPCLGLPNLLTDPHHPPIVELLQEEATPEAFATKLGQLLTPEHPLLRYQKEAFATIQAAMPTENAAANVAKVITQLLPAD